MQLRITSGTDAGKTVEVEGNEFTIGRDASCDLTLNDGKASRRHAALRVLPDGRATLYDLGSSNGTYVDGKRVQSMLLTGNEQVQIGDTVLSAVTSPAAQPLGGAEGVTSVGQVVPAGGVGVTPPPQPVPTAPPPPQQPQQQTPPTQQQPAAGPPQTGQPFGGFQPPTATPVQRPSRTQSAIQRIMLQRAVNRATIVGVVAIVVAVGVGVAALLGAFAGDKPKATLTNAQIVDKAKPSTFFIVTDKDFANGGGGGRGTGWVWDAGQGLIVTNAHVVAGGKSWSVGSGDHLKIQVTDGGLNATPNGKSAKLLGQANCEDIAVLKVDDKAGLKTLPRASQKTLKLGDHVVAVGYPSTLNTTTDMNFDSPGVTSGDLTATSGDVSQVETTFGAIPGEGAGDPTVGPYKNVILTDAVINQGNSGGPLVDEKARLVGMNSAVRTDVQGQNYAVGVDRIKEIVPQLLGGQDVCGDGNGALAEDLSGGE
jgi:putative serine protease PepD